MKLYHFTPEHLLFGIKQEGICKGKIPVLLGHTTVLGFMNGNWFTANPAWLQEWCNPEYSSLPYDRSAVRLTLDFPEDFPVIQWEKFAVGKLSTTAKILGEFADPSNWWISEDPVPVDFIQAVDFKPKVVT